VSAVSVTIDASCRFLRSGCPRASRLFIGQKWLELAERVENETYNLSLGTVPSNWQLVTNSRTCTALYCPETELDDRFHESCHNRGIHLDFRTPISAP
jgi:hypothetical protein